MPNIKGNNIQHKNIQHCSQSCDMPNNCFSDKLNAILVKMCKWIFSVAMKDSTVIINTALTEANWKSLGSFVRFKSDHLALKSFCSSFQLVPWCSWWSVFQSTDDSQSVSKLIDKLLEVPARQSMAHIVNLAVQQAVNPSTAHLINKNLHALVNTSTSTMHNNCKMMVKVK